MVISICKAFIQVDKFFVQAVMKLRLPFLLTKESSVYLNKTCKKNYFVSVCLTAYWTYNSLM